MTQIKDSDELDRKLGVFVEHMNDQFTRVLEAVDSRTAPIVELQRDMSKKLQKVSDKVEFIEADVRMLTLTVSAIKNDTKMLKLRSDQAQESDDAIRSDLRALTGRVSKLEAA